MEADVEARLTSSGGPYQVARVRIVEHRHS